MRRTAKALLALALPLLAIPLAAQEANDTLPLPCERCITEDYQIPSYNLYQQDWNSEHVRIKSLGVSLGDNADIKIILVDNDNNPFAMPCEVLKVNSGYGIRGGSAHTGIDLKISYQAPIYACFDGVVRMAKEYGAYGKLVVIRHYNGLETVYAHLDSIMVQPNEIVDAGQTIGLGGHTGRASGDHLHFETRFLYEHFNPAKMIDFEESELHSNVLSISKEEFEMASVAADSEPKEGAKPTSNATPSSNVYVVKAGDTLFAISRKTNVPVEKLYQLNNLNENSTLQIGQKIRLK